MNWKHTATILALSTVIASCSQTKKAQTYHKAQSETSTEATASQTESITVTELLDTTITVSGDTLTATVPMSADTQVVESGGQRVEVFVTPKGSISVRAIAKPKHIPVAINRTVQATSTATKSVKHEHTMKDVYKQSEKERHFPAIFRLWWWILLLIILIALVRYVLRHWPFAALAIRNFINAIRALIGI